MALNKREKTLATATGLLFVPFVGWKLLGTLGGSTSALQAQRANLISEVNSKNETIRNALTAEQKLDVWREHALPADPQVARTLYQNWLLRLSEDPEYGVQFEGTDIVPGDVRPEKAGAYHRLYNSQFA